MPIPFEHTHVRKLCTMTTKLRYVIPAVVDYRVMAAVRQVSKPNAGEDIIRYIRRKERT